LSRRFANTWSWTTQIPNRSCGSNPPMTSWRVSRDFVCEFLTQDT